MIDKQILKLREELNNSIINGEDYETIYKISVELDELIAEYYKKETSKQNLNLGSIFLKRINKTPALGEFFRSKSEW